MYTELREIEMVLNERPDILELMKLVKDRPEVIEELNSTLRGSEVMNYIKIDFNDVEGYDKLSDIAKKTFERVYKAHNSSQGNDYKERYIPVRVKEHKDHLEVHFKDGEWLHYTSSGEWY